MSGEPKSFTGMELSRLGNALQSLRRFILSKNFVVQYSVSIATGFSNLLSLTLFGKLFNDPETYSSVATVLSTFSSYFVFLELGYNAELTRDFESKKPDQSEIDREAQGFLSLLYLRMGLTCFLVLAAFLQGFFSGLGGKGALIFGVFSLSLFVYSLLATFDSYYWAKGVASRSISVKIVRILVALLLPALICFFPTQDLVQIFGFYSAFVLSFGIGVSVVHRSLLKSVFYDGALPVKDYFKSFALRCLKSAATPSLGLISVLILQTALFKAHGVGNLASYVAAVSLLAPVTIALQTICQLVLKDLTYFTTHDLAAAGKHIKKTNALILVIGILGLVGVLGLYKLGVIDVFLKHLDHSFVWTWAALGLQNIFLAMQVQHINFLQLRQRYRTLFKTSLILFSSTTAVVAYLTVGYGLIGYLLSALVTSGLSFYLISQISRRELKNI